MLFRVVSWIVFSLQAIHEFTRTPTKETKEFCGQRDERLPRKGTKHKEPSSKHQEKITKDQTAV
ncbi:MAG TPA: hypothetical protein VIK24_02865, partial [Pyrinomonadaceae bacterium]